MLCRVWVPKVSGQALPNAQEDGYRTASQAQKMLAQHMFSHTGEILTKMDTPVVGIVEEVVKDVADEIVELRKYLAAKPDQKAGIIGTKTFEQHYEPSPEDERVQIPRIREVKKGIVAAVAAVVTGRK